MSENTSPSAPWPRGPIGMGLLGLVLVVVGWKLSTWAPTHESRPAVEEVRRLADDELRKKLDEYTHRPAPYQVAGRLAVLAGLVLFVAAGVRMYRAPPPVEPVRPAVEEEQETGYEADGRDALP